MRRLILPLACLIGCGQAKTVPASPSEELAYGPVADRSLSYRDTDGFVARGDGKTWGDRGIFTGLAGYGYDCARGASVKPQLFATLANPTLLIDVDLDGFLGLYRGVSKRWLVCGDDFTEALKANKAWIEAHPSVLPPGFHTVADALFAKAGLRSAPPEGAYAALETAAIDFAGATVATHAACYRVNLSLLALQTVEALGHPVSTVGRDLFCAGALPSKIATVQQFCGKPGLADFLAAFKYNIWQYKFQRCEGWETPDGTDEAGVDYLVAYRDLHGD